MTGLESSSGAPTQPPQPLGAPAALADRWDGLAEAAGNPYGTREWVEAWWESHGGDGTLDIRGAHDSDGRLAAILPLYRRRLGPATVVRFLGHGPADELGPLCAPGDASLAVAALRWIATESARVVVLADRLPREGSPAALLAGAAVRRESSPALVTAGRSWDEWLSGQSANFRQQVRRRQRKLAREHGLRIRLSDDSARLQDDLGVLFRLHRARWAGGGSAWPSPADEALHRAFAPRALERGWLRLWIAEVDGQPAAAWYGLRYAGRDWYYQAGRDPAWDRLAIGFVLLVHTVRDAFENGAREYRFGLGDEAYKERFATTDPGLVTAVLAQPAVERLLRTGAAGLRRLPPRARALLSRRAA